MTRFNRAAALIITALFAVTATMPVQAHSSCPAVCGVAGCTAAGLHSHDGCDYSTSSSYASCNVEGCLEAGVHTHDDITYAGCSAPAVCNYENCTSTCAHVHDGAVYGAHHAGDGHSYCRSSQETSHHRGHHGRGHH